MKRLSFIFGALMLLALAACVNEKISLEDQFAGEKITVKAYMPEGNTPSTRVGYTYTSNEDPITLSWTEGDAFSVIRGGENQTFIKSEGTNDFSGTLPTEGSDDFYAVYPVVESNDHTKVPFDISNQNSLPYLMYAVSEDGSVYEFKHAVAYLNVTFPGDFKGKNVAISITTPNATDGTFSLIDGVIAGGTKRSINKYVTFGQESTDVLFALPPMIDSDKTLNFTITTPENVYTYTLSGTPGTDIQAGYYYNAAITDLTALTKVEACYLPSATDFNFNLSYNKGDATTILFETSAQEIPSGAIECNPAKGEKYYLYKDGSTLKVLTTAKQFVFNENCNGMFRSLSKITQINFNNCVINTSLVKDMKQMFMSCAHLISVYGLSNFNTSSVTDMSSMFRACKALTEIDLSGLNTSAVTNMKQMFYSCQALPNINVSSFNTSSVTDMSGMFHECYALTEIDLSGFNTSAVTDMSLMFKLCKVITEIDLGSFNTSSVTTMSEMFSNCLAVEEINVGSFNTENVTNMANMFYNCQKVKDLDLSSFNTSLVETMYNMFGNCFEVNNINVSNFNTEKVTTMDSMFDSCKKIQNIELGSFNTSSVTTMYHMFYGCSILTHLDLCNFAFNATNYSSMFWDCPVLDNIYVKTSEDVQKLTSGYCYAKSGALKVCTTHNQ